MPNRTQSKTLLLGFEHELALFGTTTTGQPSPLSAVLDCCESAAREHLQHVGNRSREGGIFLANGGRFYRDSGGHLELCSPEVDHPDELVRQVLAGERLIRQLATYAEGAGELKEVHLSASNISYASGNSWGHHENYSPGNTRADDMLSFLATRFILSGGGGFVNRSNLILFTLSPRTHFLTVPTGIDTQNDRTLHNLKNEALGNESRCHVISGDGNQSHTSYWLRFATAALVVGALDRGARVPPAGKLLDPVDSAHQFALDPTCQAPRRTEDGRTHTAVEIQRVYLDLVRENLSNLPDWAPLACERWGTVLDQLQSGHWEALETSLDWCIKRRLVFERHILRSGWDWDKIAAWNRAVEHLESRLNQELSYPLKLDPSLVQQPDATFQMALASGWLRGDGIDVDELLGYTNLREELRELDLRYMLVGPESLFEQLDAVGCLAHQVDGVALPCGDPLDPPSPPRGRAGLRADLVRKHGTRGSGRNKRFTASWVDFYDTQKKRVIDMSNVHETKLEWKPREASPARQRPALQIRVDAMRLEQALATAEAAINNGTLENAAEALDSGAVRGIVQRPHFLPIQRASYWRRLARVQARRQDLGATMEALAALAEIEPDRFELLADDSNCRHMLTLRTHPSAEVATAAMREYLQDHSEPRFSGLTCWRAHTAGGLNRHGSPEAARELLESSLSDQKFGSLGNHVVARTHLAMAEALRLSGNTRELDEAVRFADDAVSRYRRTQLDGPLAELGLLQVAKVRHQLGHTGEAIASLHEALKIQTRLVHPAALRTILLLARTDKSLSATARKRLRAKANRLKRTCSAFKDCALARKITTEHWDAWTTGQNDPDPPGAEDFFWGV